MEFILEQQAKNQEMLASLLTAQSKSETRMDCLERVVVKLSRLGVHSRSRLNGRLDDHERRMAEHEKWLADQKLLMHEIGEKLNALIDVVDRWPRNPAA